MPAVKNRPVDSAPTRLRHRKSVDKLAATQLAALRDAVGRMAALGDDRGYQYYASLHGGPPRAYCQHGFSDTQQIYHGAPLFLPWHRAYLHNFELALQDQNADATLAWWDWSSPKAHTSGIPAAYAAASVKGRPNPLHEQPIRPDRPRSAPPTETWRTPDRPSRLPTAAAVEHVLGLSSFQDFSTQLEQQLHNAVHGWVGGAMGQIPIAAFDPIFWAHHTMVDRLWSLWQLRHGAAGPPAAAGHTVLAPFAMTVADTFNARALGYDYAGSTAHAAGTT
jgi:tyrosinase